MSSASLRLSIRRHQFNVSCAAQDEDEMRRAAKLVEDKIRQLRDKTGVADGERAALMAALQIAFESESRRKSAADSASDSVADSVADSDSAALNWEEMLRRIDGALARTESSLQGRAPMAWTNET